MPYGNIKSHKKSEFHPFFRRYIIGKTLDFLKVSGDSLETVRKLRLSTKFLHQEIR